MVPTVKPSAVFPLLPVEDTAEETRIIPGFFLPSPLPREPETL